MLRLHKKIFTIFGMIYVKKTSTIVIGLFIFFHPCFLALLDFVHILFALSDLDKLIWILEVTFLGIAINLKIGTMYWQRDKIEFMFHFVEQHQKKLPKRYKKLSKRIAYYFRILVVITIIIYSFKPFSIISDQNGPINITQILIYPTWLPFRTNTFTHSLLLLWQFFVGLYSALFLFLWDTFVVSMMIFITGQLRYIHVSVKNLPVESDLNKKLMIQLIEHHQNVIRFVKIFI